jgi:hypothetical protein
MRPTKNGIAIIDTLEYLRIALLGFIGIIVPAD